MSSTASMPSNQTPQLRLVIEDSNQNEVKSMSMVWNPANILNGRIEIISKRNLVISEATVFLEGLRLIHKAPLYIYRKLLGLSRNWVGTAVGTELLLHVMKAERKFLSQTLTISPSMINEAIKTIKGFCWSIPFYFIISRLIASSNPESPEHCLQLPPSIELGGVLVDEISGNRFAQPSISYHLRAVVKFAELEQHLPRPIEISLPIVIMPHTEEFPPTEVNDFPTEFKVQEKKELRQSLFGRILGTMTISMEEPRALIYNFSSVKGSTEGHLTLEFQSPVWDDVYQSLQSMKFTIYSLVRVKTFYSTKSFPRLPSQSFLSQRGDARMRDDIIKLETRIISGISWGFQYDSLKHTARSEVAVSPNEEPLDSLFEHDDGPKLVFETNLLPQQPQQPQGRWIAKITHSINIESRLLPTFCSSIVARLYSVVLRVKTSGIRRESFDLEVPLQVVHLSPNGLSNEETQYAEAVTGPIGEHPDFLEFRRASATSWFSNESLENEEIPPQYHP